MSLLLDYFEANVSPLVMTHFGDSLVMSTGPETQTITGVFEGNRTQQADEDGVLIELDDDTILLRTVDVSIEIQKGTRFCHHVGGKTVVWVAYASGGDSPWEYDEQQGRLFIRVRVKRVMEETDAS